MLSKSRRERRAVGDDAIVHLIRAGVDRGATRRARRGLRIVPRQSHALARYAVKGRCLDEWMTRRTVGVPAELVKRDEKDVHFAAST